MNKYQEALNKIKEQFGCDPAYYGLNCEFETLQKLVDQTKTPTEEEIIKEWEELGYEWWYNKKENVIELNKYEKTNGMILLLGKIEIDLDDKEYWSDICFNMKEHQLLTKTFKYLGWFE